MWNDKRLFDRELGQLAFYHRVLQEARSKKVPLYERLGFLSIYSDNLAEFYRVRVASLRSLLSSEEKKKRKGAGKELKAITKAVAAQQKDFEEILNQHIVPALAKKGVLLTDEKGIGKADEPALREYFEKLLRPSLRTFTLGDPEIFLENNQVYLTCKVGEGDAAINKLITLPADMPRFYMLPRNGEGEHKVLYNDDIVRYFLKEIFPGERVGRAYALLLTRDGDLRPEQEFIRPLADRIRENLEHKEVSLPVRFLYDAAMPKVGLNFFVDSLGLSDDDPVPGGRYLKLGDLRELPNPASPKLEYEPMPPLDHPVLGKVDSLFKQIRGRDVLLHYPFHSFQYVIDLLNEAATDPAVKIIYITLYRIARDSRIVEALKNAAQNGKRVIVYAEAKVRDDEVINEQAARVLGAAGATVLPNDPRLKVHAKMFLIERQESDKLIRYAYLSSGNFNEKSAKRYTDLGLMTADRKLTKEVGEVFELVSDFAIRGDYDELLVAPDSLRFRITELIDAETKRALRGESASIFLKINNLEDEKIIPKLYEAAEAGVKVRLIVRSICCLNPELKELDGNMEARSIVDRFLEHTRIVRFENGGEPLYYVSSADWMTRNLDRRVEIAFPILDKRLKEEVQVILDTYWDDNQKARRINAGQSNPFHKSGGKKVQAQLALYAHYQEALKAK